MGLSHIESGSDMSGRYRERYRVVRVIFGMVIDC